MSVYRVLSCCVVFQCFVCFVVTLLCVEPEAKRAYRRQWLGRNDHYIRSLTPHTTTYIPKVDHGNGDHKAHIQIGQKKAFPPALRCRESSKSIEETYRIVPFQTKFQRTLSKESKVAARRKDVLLDGVRSNSHPGKAVVCL